MPTHSDNGSEKSTGRSLRPLVHVYEAERNYGNASGSLESDGDSLSNESPLKDLYFDVSKYVNVIKGGDPSCDGQENCPHFPFEVQTKDTNSINNAYYAYRRREQNVVQKNTMDRALAALSVERRAA